MGSAPRPARRPRLPPRRNADFPPPKLCGLLHCVFTHLQQANHPRRYSFSLSPLCTGPWPLLSPSFPRPFPAVEVFVCVCLSLFLCFPALRLVPRSPSRIFSTKISLPIPVKADTLPIVELPACGGYTHLHARPRTHPFGTAHASCHTSHHRGPRPGAALPSRAACRAETFTSCRMRRSPSACRPALPSTPETARSPENCSPRVPHA